MGRAGPDEGSVDLMEIASPVYSFTMRSNLQIFRWLSERLPVSPRGRRLVVITGARQTGKTTLVRTRYSDVRYLNLDAAEDRARLVQVAAARWGRDVGAAVLDGAQKESGVFEKVKYAYDAHDIDFSVLLGSSRFLLMDQVRETLAGRAFVYELWPLMACELRSGGASSVPERPLLDLLLDAPGRIDQTMHLESEIRLGEDAALRRAALAHLSAWGGMPELLRLDDPDRREWLRSYQQTFLERDLADLVRLADFEPFRALQKLCMLRSGRLLSFAELGRDAGLSSATARRYLEYLRISYQVLLLQPYATNLTSTVIKAPKLYWMDLGLLRQGTHQWGDATGELFETLIVTEIAKWISTMAKDAEIYFYRTRSGFEVDLLIKTPNGILGLEIKSRATAVPSDATGLRTLAASLGADWLGGLVVHAGERTFALDEPASIWAVPAAYLL
jgi:uncharacterized protein